MYGENEMEYPLYEKAKILLENEYQNVFNIVKDSPYHKTFIDEKIRHSFQVSGAGNGILAQEPYFQNKSDEFIDICKTAILLHDVYRFREVLGWFESGQKIDHGEKGAELLSTLKDFNNILITLPVKHHGHMIEDLYNDALYQSLDEKTKDEVKYIIFAVRDADKIANWNLLKNEWEKVESIWLANPDDFSLAQAKISRWLWKYFIRQEVSPNRFRKTNADTMISVICWLFDINYDYSIFYAQKLNLFDGLCDILKRLHVEDEEIEKVRSVIQDYVVKKFKIQI